MRVGDILVLKSKDLIAADCVLLHSSDKNGQCFVQTDDLDGECNLKSKNALIELNDKFDEIIHAKGKQGFSAFIGPPDANLYYFDGKLEVNSEEYSIGFEQFLHRGATI